MGKGAGMLEYGNVTLGHHGNDWEPTANRLKLAHAQPARLYFGKVLVALLFAVSFLDFPVHTRQAFLDRRAVYAEMTRNLCLRKLVFVIVRSALVLPFCQSRRIQVTAHVKFLLAEF